MTVNPIYYAQIRISLNLANLPSSRTKIQSQQLSPQVLQDETQRHL